MKPLLPPHSSLLQLWQLESQRMNHMRRLDTIYQQQEKNRSKDANTKLTFEVELRKRNKEADSHRKQKQMQMKINHQNELLREKLLDVMIPPLKNKLRQTSKMSEADHNKSYHDMKSFESEKKKTEIDCFKNISEKSEESHSFSSPRHKLMSTASMPYHQKEMLSNISQANNLLYNKLVTMKGQVMSRLNIKAHQQRIKEFKDKLEKSSPKKRNYARSFFKRRNLEIGIPYQHYARHSSIQPQNQQELI